MIHHLTTGRVPGKVYVLMSEPPGPKSAFIELEDHYGRSIGTGRWVTFEGVDGVWALELGDPRAKPTGRICSGCGEPIREGQSMVGSDVFGVYAHKHCEKLAQENSFPQPSLRCPKNLESATGHYDPGGPAAGFSGRAEDVVVLGGHPACAGCGAGRVEHTKRVSG